MQHIRIRCFMIIFFPFLFLIRTGRIELPLSPYQRDFLPLKDVREPVEVVETSSTAWRAVVIAVILYGLIVGFY